MTTIIGAKFYDPQIKQEGIIIASDSKRTWKNEINPKKKYDFKSKKILFPKNKNLIIGQAGETLGMNDIAYSDKIIQYVKNLDNLKDISKKNLELIAKKINFAWKGEKTNYNTSFLFAKNDGKNLSLNQFYDKLKEVDIGFLGSGTDYAIKNLSEFIGGNSKNGKLISPTNKIIKAFAYAIDKTSKKDEFTGGFFNFSILTNNNRYGVEKFIPLTKELTFSKINKKYFESEQALINQEHSSFKGIKLENLIFN